MAVSSLCITLSLLLLFSLSNGWNTNTNSAARLTRNNIIKSPKDFATADATKKILTSFLGISSLLVLAPKATLASEEAFTDALSTVIAAKAVLANTKGNVESQAYDRVRTNIYYILNQMQIEKKLKSLIQNSLDVNDDMDAIDQVKYPSYYTRDVFFPSQYLAYLSVVMFWMCFGAFCIVGITRVSISH